MPLHDHFRGPIGSDESWPSFHGMWAVYLMEDLVERRLPPGYRVEILTKLGQFAEVDVASLEDPSRGAPAGGNGVAVATYAPPAASEAFDASTVVPDAYEVFVFRGRRLVAAVELVSPSNKAGLDDRRAFSQKCASFLRSRVCVVIVDIVTNRHADLFGETLAQLGINRGPRWAHTPPVYVATMRLSKVEQSWQLQTWGEPLSLGQPLPVMPLWLADDLAVPLMLEPTYLTACRLHRIPRDHP